MDKLHSALLIVVIAIVTIAIRFLPFIIFNGKNKTPKYIEYLSRVLPFAIMGMLVVYCLRNTSFVSYPYGIPEIISSLVVILLHLFKKNTLLSIISGTACYMLLVQFIFV